MDPANTIITKLGGARRVAEAVGVHRTRVYKWIQPRAKGGTDGLIPQKYHLTLLDFAAANKIKLKPADFLPVRDQVRDNSAA